MGEIKVSPDYNWFRSTVPLKKIIVDDDDSKVWSLYDAGPRSIRCPLIFLPPVSGTADVFFQQILALTGWGYRVIALQYPVYWDHLEFCDGFRKLLDHLQLDKVHLFGASLGGFLAQKFAEYTHKSPRVQSLILCNSFSDTSIFNQTWTANSFWLMPAFMLKKIVLGNFASGPLDPEMADGIDFMVDRLESLGQSELASRLTLNCQNSYVEPHKIRDIPVTIMDVFDQSALSTEAKEEMYKLYPNARRAHLKTGGNFPYLCRSAEVNLYIQVSLCTQTQSTNAFSQNSCRKHLFCAYFYFLACLSSVCSGLQIADTGGHGWEQPRSRRAGFGGLAVACFLCPLSEHLVLQSHDFILSKIILKECFSFTKTLCFCTCFSVIFHVQQIHLLQFHGTRYAAIDPSMVSAEELEVQKIRLHTSNEQEEQ
uniref:Maspardin n=1 Tax=Falco tinnunculus TaxID=100819 RepID=A0A8C4TQH6_FALTI